MQPCHADRMHIPRLRPLADDDAAADLAREQSRRARGMLTGVTDAHTHLFPDAFYAALWRWFDVNAWQIAFRGTAQQVLAELDRIGTSHAVALVFGHKPGTARHLNQFLGDLCRSAPQVVGVGTVLPGEPDAPEIVKEAIGRHGLRGIKIHCHVQKMAIDDPRVMQVLEICQDIGVPAVVHAGREPASSAYGVDTRVLCSAERTASVLQRLPQLRLVVPHVGADEYPQYFKLLAEHEHLYLDTSMACAEYFEVQPDWAEIERWSHRILYGTDFPIVPYEADRELRLLARRIQADAAFERIVRGTAQALWNIV